MQRAVLYLRQSLDKEGTELGIERQLLECQRLADARGYTVVEIIKDNNRSATHGERPGYERVLHLINSQLIDVVVVLRIDRLLRRPVELEWLIDLCEQTRVSVATVDGMVDLTNASGRQVARLQSTFARWEVEVKSERHKLANAQKAAAGKPHGSRRPYGYNDDQMTIRESEAKILREMADRIIAGHSYKEVAWWLNEQGHKTTFGKVFYPITVRNMLRKPRYAGQRLYEGVTYEGLWEPIFKMTQWRRLQTVLDTRRHLDPDRPTARRYLLTGLLFCGKCGQPLNGTNVKESLDKKRNRIRPGGRIYNCRVTGDTKRRGGCGGVRRNADALDDFIKECMIYRLDSPQLAQLLNQGNTAEDAELRTLLEQRGDQQRRLDGFVDALAEGILDQQQFSRANTVGKQRLVEIDRQIAGMNRHLVEIRVPAGQTVRDAWDKSESDSWRRALLSLFINRIVVNPGITKPYYDLHDGRRMRFDPELIDIEWSA